MTAAKTFRRATADCRCMTTPHRPLAAALWMSGAIFSFTAMAVAGLLIYLSARRTAQASVRPAIVACDART